MKFYNRESELLELERLWDQTQNGGRLAVLTGRRRLGKTWLAKEFGEKHPFLYFFVEKKPEALLCEGWVSILREKMTVVGEIKQFRDFFILLLEYAKRERIVVVIDEFQEFYQINPSVYSEVQNLWDSYKKESKMLFIAVGSVYSLMHKIFEDKKEPLFGRFDRLLKLNCFSIQTLEGMLKDYGILELKELFDFYVLTGSSPKYLDILMTNGTKSKDQILSFMLGEFSPFLEEGKNLLIEEFGKEYGTYFAVLELLSMGKTSRPEIESILGFTVGGYMEKLEDTYNLIYRVLPIDGKPASRLVKFAIKDRFLNFWFRFFFRNSSAIELKNFAYVRRLIDRDYSVYCGRFLENFFIDLLARTKKYNRIGSYWEAKNLNEIDIVAINDLDKEMLLVEVKTNPKKLDLQELKRKSENLLRKYPDYQVKWAGWSLLDAKQFLGS